MISQTDIRIREMAIDDYEDVYKLWAATQGICLRNVDDSYEGINKFLKRNPDTCFVAIDEQNKIIGAILCGSDGRRGYIYHLAVHKSYRKMGTGKKLVQKASNSLRESGIKKAALLVLNTNKAGNGFWQNIGYYKRDDIIYRDKSLDDKNI